MSEPPPRAQPAIILLLAGLAGAVDACGYSVLKDLYVSFMSGNTTSLGAAVAHGKWGRAELIGLILLAFVAGAAAGQVVAIRSGRRHEAVVVTFVAALLAIPPFLPAATVMAFAFAMGALNAATQHQGGVHISLTYVTGTLVKFGQGLGSALCGKPGLAFVGQVTPWIGMLAGAALATAGLVQDERATVIALPVLASVAAGLAWLTQWRTMMRHPAIPDPTHGR